MLIIGQNKFVLVLFCDYLEMSSYVRIVKENGDEIIELPLENDSTLLLSTLQSTIPKACGLKHCLERNGAMQAVKLSDSKFFPPEEGWQGKVFVTILSKDDKRKAEDDSFAPARKKPAMSDLIILGLAWRTTEDEVRAYFQSFGEVSMVVVKTDQITGLSKGFGFVRFCDPDVQTKVISQRHFIGGRWCDVKIPNLYSPDKPQSCKIFVGQLTGNISAVQLRKYFSTFGVVTDIFIPQPFRMFAFVTFARPDEAKSVCDTKTHSINGVPINVSEAIPLARKNPRIRFPNHQYNFCTYFNMPTPLHSTDNNHSLNVSSPISWTQHPFERYSFLGVPSPTLTFNCSAIQN